MTSTAIPATCGHELRFQPLAPDTAALAFPCDADGHVDLDGLDDPTREAYLFARAVMGRALARPTVRFTPALAAPVGTSAPAPTPPRSRRAG